MDVEIVSTQVVEQDLLVNVIFHGKTGDVNYGFKVPNDKAAQDAIAQVVKEEAAWAEAQMLASQFVVDEAKLVGTIIKV